MKFNLGQKVKYKRISKKININMQYWTLKDFKEGEEKVLTRREFIELGKERIGYVMGRRNLVFKTIFAVKDTGLTGYDDEREENPPEYVDIERQEKKFVYVVAYDMGHTNFVLEEDLKFIFSLHF